MQMKSSTVYGATGSGGHNAAMVREPQLALASGRTIAVYDLRVGAGGQLAPMVELNGHAAGVTTLSWVDGRHLFSGSFDGTIRLWSLQGHGTELRQLRVGDEGKVTGLVHVPPPHHGTVPVCNLYYGTGAGYSWNVKVENMGGDEVPAWVESRQASVLEPLDDPFEFG